MVIIIGVLVYIFIWKPRKNRKRKLQRDDIYSDTVLSPMRPESQEMDHYTDIDLRPSSNYTDIDLQPSSNYTDIDLHDSHTSGHYMDIDLPSPFPPRNTHDNSTAPDPSVQYGKVNKPKNANGEESKMLNNNVTDGLTGAEEDETVMQENTELYS